MRNSVDIDHSHSRAIVRKIGEALRASLEIDRELPASLRTQIDRLRELMGEVERRHAGVRLGLTGIPVLESDELRSARMAVVFVALAQVKPDADCHQCSSGPEGRGHSARPQHEGDHDAEQRSHREVGASARGAQCAQGAHEQVDIDDGDHWDKPAEARRGQQEPTQRQLD